MSRELLCNNCRGRLDAVLTNVGRHPGCGLHRPLAPDAFDRLVAAIADALGATRADSTSYVSDLDTPTDSAAAQ